MHNGFGRLPRALSPEVEVMDEERLKRAMERMRSLVREAAACAPPHRAFLEQVY